MSYEFKNVSTSLFVNKWFAVIVNVVIFIVVFNLVGFSVEEPETELSSYVPPEAMLPTQTITNQMKVSMFFDQLRIDTTLIDSEQIALSLEPWEPYVRLYSSQYKIDPDLVRAIIYAESKGDPYSISRDGAQGLMQIMPSTANSLGFTDVLNPENNINAGVKYIAWLIKNYNEDYMLWAWNAGPSKIGKYHMPGETKKFIVEVLSIQNYLKDDKHKAI